MYDTSMNYTYGMTWSFTNDKAAQLARVSQFVPRVLMLLGAKINDMTKHVDVELYSTKDDRPDGTYGLIRRLIV
jgi:hypothetical protein